MRHVVSLGISVFILFLAGAHPSSSKLGTLATIQHRGTVQKLYGSPVSETYRASQNLAITASFASNGTLCRAHIKSDVEVGITDKELNAVLDELAPKDVRGEFKIGTFLNVICLKYPMPEKSSPDSIEKPSMQLAVDPCEDCSGVSEDYEQVNITKYGNTNRYSSVNLNFHQPECNELDRAHH